MTAAVRDQIRAEVEALHTATKAALKDTSHA